MRLTLALAVAAALAAGGAVVLGEYTFDGLGVMATGLVFGLLVAEAAMAVHRGTAVPLAVGCGAIAVAAMVWAGWIASGHDLSFVGPAGWTGVALAGLAAGVRAGWSRPAAGTAPAAPARESSPEEGPR